MASVLTQSGSPSEVSAASRELIQFFVLAVAVSWTVGGAAVAALGVYGLGLGALCPGLVALWLTRRHQGTMRPMLQHITRWRLGVGWYAAALLAPAVVAGGAYLLVLVTGGTWGTVEEPFTGPEVAVFLVLAVILNGGPEEPGWRGYALPRLQTRWNALVATVVLAAVWAIWHAPLWFFPDLFFADMNYWLYALQILGMSLVYTWLFNSTGGSILLAMVLHASTNTVVTAFVPSSFDAQLASTLVWCALGVGLVVRRGATHLSAQRRIDRARALQLA